MADGLSCSGEQPAEVKTRNGQGVLSPASMASATTMHAQERQRRWQRPSSKHQLGALLGRKSCAASQVGDMCQCGSLRETARYDYSGLTDQADPWIALAPLGTRKVLDGRTDLALLLDLRPACGRRLDGRDVRLWGFCRWRQARCEQDNAGTRVCRETRKLDSSARWAHYGRFLSPTTATDDLSRRASLPRQGASETAFHVAWPRILRLSPRVHAQCGSSAALLLMNCDPWATPIALSILRQTARRLM